MKKTVFKITQMDCPSEETLIRMKLESLSNIRQLDFDIQNRQLTVYHEGDYEMISKGILDLNLGGKFINSQEINEIDLEENNHQKKLLWSVLIINLSFFFSRDYYGVIFEFNRFNGG